MNHLKLSLRNLHRNIRRSLVTVISIAFGFTAIALFSGYTQIVYRGLSDQAVHGELLGHLTLTKQGLHKEGRLHPEQYLLTQEDIAKISAVIHHEVPAASIVPRLSLSGLLSNGHISTIFLAEGIGPSDMALLRGPRSYASGGLADKTPGGVTISRGLADLLGVQEESEAQALVSTLYGQANAIDVSVTDTFSTGNAGTEDKFMYLPLNLAQSLYDASGRADRLTLLLPDIADTEKVQKRLVDRLVAAGFNLDIRTWQELSAFYSQVKSLFDMIFSFLLAIVLAIIVMSITNVMTISVIERTREIGTLRAIGLRRRGVVRLFLTEAILLVAIGCLFGLLVTLLLRFGINAADINYQPPNSTARVPLLIGFDVVKVLAATLILSLLGAVAAFLPARRAASAPIVIALGHV